MRAACSQIVQGVRVALHIVLCTVIPKIHTSQNDARLASRFNENKLTISFKEIHYTVIQ